MVLSKLAGGSGDRSERVVANFLEENRILECLFCKKPKGVQTRASGVNACYPECRATGCVGDSSEVIAVNWMDFLREYRSVDCHRCRGPVGLVNKTSEVFYCSPRCQTEHTKVQNASSIRQENVASSRSPTGDPVPLRATAATGLGSNGSDAPPSGVQGSGSSQKDTPATTTTAHASGMDVKQEQSMTRNTLASLTVVVAPILSSSANANIPPSSATPDAVVAPVPKRTGQQKRKQQGQEFGKEIKIKIHRLNLSTASSSTPSVLLSALSKNKKIQTKKGVKASKMYTCNVCRRQFRNIHQLRRHQYTHKTAQEKDEERKKWPGCKVCSKRFFSKTEVNRHFPVHKNKKVRKSCEMCEVVFASPKGLWAHYRNVHMTPEQRESERYCPIDSRWFNSRNALSVHINRCHLHE